MGLNPPRRDAESPEGAVVPRGSLVFYRNNGLPPVWWRVFCRSGRPLTKILETCRAWVEGKSQLDREFRERENDWDPDDRVREYQGLV